jgi:hypothetical protein
MGINHTPNLNLTTAEELTLRAYHKWIQKHGAAPSVRQLASMLDKGHTATHHALIKLREKGYLNAARPITETRMRISAKGKRAL